MSPQKNENNKKQKTEHYIERPVSVNVISMWPPISKYIPYSDLKHPSQPNKHTAISSLPPPLNIGYISGSYQHRKHEINKFVSRLKSRQY